MIKLFDIEGGVVKPTAHCQLINWLKVIQEKFPDNSLKIYAYIFYMACPNEENPYFNYKEEVRESIVIKDLDIDFSLEEDEIIEALEKATSMYETPTIRAYKAVSTMLDKMATYMEETEITAGRDGNITALIRMVKEFDGIRQSFKGVARDLKEEQQTSVRGGQDLAYDQM